MTNRLRISDAVTADGAPANLAQVDFIMVQTGVNAKAPLIGEVSTEVSGIGCYRTVTKTITTHGNPPYSGRQNSKFRER